jgi:hypothetical protein
MEEPSSPPPAAEHPESDRAPLKELIHLYRTEQAMLIAHQREVDRRRAAVRDAAEQEASEIILAARREIRRVLLRTRHELVALTAQVQAAGCGALPSEPDEPTVGGEFQLSAARDVRGVLREARSDLLTLSRDAANFWPAPDEVQLPASAVEAVPIPEPAAAEDVSAFSRQANDGDADSYRAEAPITSLAEKLIAHWRPAAVVLVVVALVVTLIVAMRASSTTDPAVTAPQPEAARSTASAQPPEPPAARAAASPSNASSGASSAVATAGSEALSLALEVKRPVWLRINADGGEDAGRTYQEGERRTIQAVREILVRAGDAGAVFVSLGGAAPTPLGPDGQVRTRRFARAGMEQTGLRPTTTQPVEVPYVPVAPRSAAETSTPAQPDRAATPTQDAVAAEREILERHQRWFDAFEHGDRATMASIATENFSLVDQRPERAPTASGRVEHSIQDVRVRVTAGIGAVLSGRIAETTATSEATVAMLSEVWIRQADEWRLVSVRMVPLAAVATTLQ